MSFSVAAEHSILALIFNATAWANLADNTATAPLTNLQLSLHTADPTGGTQGSAETAYTGYARAPVARAAGGFTVTGAAATLTAALNFAAGSAGGDTVSYFGIGSVATGATSLLIAGTVTPNITTGTGITPQLTTATSITLS